MDSWTLQGDSYSFLRSTPRTFSLCHREGTPNHVEIFDIINVPAQRSAISETTCLCDIFGDDCESQSLSSSPAVGVFIPSQREVDRTDTASPPVDDLNDSSGSYHTAQGSSEGEDGFEESRERIFSPQLQSKSPETVFSENKGLTLGQPEFSVDSSTNSEPKSKSPAPQVSTPSPSFPRNGVERTPPPGYNSPCTLSPEGRLSSLSSSSLEKRHSPSLPDPREARSTAEPKRITPSFQDRCNSPSSNQSPSPQPTNRVSPSSSETADSFLSESIIEQNLPKLRTSNVKENISPPPDLTLGDFSQDFTESALETRTTISSCSSSATEISSHLRETSLSPDLRNRSSCSDTQAYTSPFSVRRGRISLPDLFSRDSTPDIKDFSPTPERVSDPSTSQQETAATPPELVESTVSPDLRSEAPSPGSLSAASSAKTGTSTPSPDLFFKIKHCSSFSNLGTEGPSPVGSYTLSPSPRLRNNSCPIEHRYTSPSPEIRITASSPEICRKERTSTLPLTEHHSDSASSRSLTSSPHITGISYSVVQPEDRCSPAFPELSRLSSPEQGRFCLPCEERSLAASRGSTENTTAESTRIPQDSARISEFTGSETDVTQLHQSRYQTPSPQSNHLSPSPEPRYRSPSSDRYQSASPQHRGGRASPAASLPSGRSLHSPATTEHNSPSIGNTAECDTDFSTANITKTQSPTHSTKDRVSPSIKTERREKSPDFGGEPKALSSVTVVHSSTSLSPRGLDGSLKQQNTEKEETQTQVKIQDKSNVAGFSEENKSICFPVFQREDAKSKSPSPHLTVSKNPSLSPTGNLLVAISDSSVQRQENLQTQVTTYPPSSDCSENQRRQQLNRVRLEKRERVTEDMFRHVNRRRTPSPPLTRFTPVHIIAPEKPYRQWQNRSCSPSQVIAPPPSGNLKKAATNRESPNVALVDNNSQAHWVSPGRQLEMEREMLLEQEQDMGWERQRDRDRERKREEQAPEREESWQGDGNYRGKQTVLSFSARNRKGPASRGTAPTSRETHHGLPTLHSCTGSLLATRQLQQQHSLHRLASQEDTRGGGVSRRPQPPAAHHKSRRVATNRSCRSSSSSMGSELDDADNEVKWFTDVAFRSLSSPEADYLDMYNSSHRSSTNTSQPSTQESPARINAVSLAYAEFKGSAPKQDHDELSFQQPPAYFADGLDPSRRYEMGSFECVDVAVEREDAKKLKRGVPKRQILLKKKDSFEGKQDESSGNSSPGLPESHSRATFVRQHSTPAAMQESYPSDHSPEPSQIKPKLQKSASMDETCSKTKMASCLIKSVLAKKMHGDDKQPDDQAGEAVSPTFEKSSPPTKTVTVPLKESPKPETHLSCSLQSDCSLSSEALSLRGEATLRDEPKAPKSFGMRSSHRPSSSSSNRSVSFSLSDNEEVDSQTRSAASSSSELRSELKVSFESKQVRNAEQGADEIRAYEREDDDSANANVTSTGAPSDSGFCMRGANRDQGCENTVDSKTQQQGDKKSAFTSKTQEATLHAVGKKKASLNVCLTPEAENKPEAFSPDLFFREQEEKIETSVNEKTEEEENENNKAKGPIHKVRDVRRLVKNTYNLSFKAASAEERVENFIEEKREEVKVEEGVAVREEIRREEKGAREEEFWEDRKEVQTDDVSNSDMSTLSPPTQTKEKSLPGSQPMQIEFKAVCLKEDKNKMLPTEKDSESQEDKATISSKAVTEDPVSSGKDATNIKLRAHEENITQNSKMELNKVPDHEDKPVVRRPPMLGTFPKLPSKEREVSTAVVLIRDGSSRTKTSASPAKEEIPIPVQGLAASPSSGPATQASTSNSGGHSVSMLLKEKGYQADIGAVVGDSHSAAGNKGVSHKHVNSLEIPLQTITPSDGRQTKSHRERTFSSSSATSAHSAVSDNSDSTTKIRVQEGRTVAEKDASKQRVFSPLRNAQEQIQPITKQPELGDFEAVKRLDPTFPPRSPAIRRFKPQPIEVKSLSKDPQKKEMLTNSVVNNRPQSIEVKSIAKNSHKPAVPPKPSYKFKPADLGVNETQRPSATMPISRPQGEERSQTIVLSSPTIYRKLSNESTSTSNLSRKLAVSAVSSLKPPPSKTATTKSSSLASHRLEPSVTETSDDRGQQQQQPPPTSSPQSFRFAQKPPTIASVPMSNPSSGGTKASGPVFDPKPNQISESVSAGASQPSQSAVGEPLKEQSHREANPHEQALPETSNNTKQLTAVSTAQMQRYAQQPHHRSLSSNHSQRPDDLRFYASDDPPSYDERESFSPLLLPDVAPPRSNRYQPSSRPPPCSCTAACPSHPSLTAPHHHRSPHDVTPPHPPHSPGQALPYPVAQPPLRPHHCRPEPLPMSYQPSSPKLSNLGPGQPPGMYQPLHQPAPCPPHPTLVQDRPLLPPQHIDSRRPPIHRSPHQQLPGMTGGPYSDPSHTHSPDPLDPQYMCGPQSMGPSYGSEYGGDSSSLYSESNYGQTPRRVLLDPETGKYFYIEVPVQPLRKMLFDPETGQYVEVLIPQQAVPHSSMYPPATAPYPPLHNPNIFATQYMPYAAAPAPAHPHPQPQPPRYPEASGAAATMHPSGPGVGYRNSSAQGSKPEPQNHPPLDHSYLESMYYVPTGMNTSPNPTPPDYFHKHPPNLPPTGGKRS
ncbi:uncharacterized protein KZ484_026018 [Pholidichthys leucotaenia]